MYRSTSLAGAPMRLAILGLFGVLSVTPTARADAPCASLPAPIYVAGSSAAAPLLKTLAMALIKGAVPVALVHQQHGSCAGVEAVARDTDDKTCQQGACLSGTATFYTQDGQAKTCQLLATGTHAHVALSDVFPQSCPTFGGGVPPGLVDRLGPVSALAVAAPQGADEPAIQAEEAHFVFGFGAAGRVPPWVNGDEIFVRDERSGGQVLLGLHIQVPPGRFKGKLAVDADDMMAQLISGDPGHKIGFLPTSLLDPQRAQLRTLAFQALGQKGAFYPDRTAKSFEKQNVRDGHYPLWGYLHLIARADPAKPDQPQSSEAGRFFSMITDQPGAGAGDPLLWQVQAGLVPQCAMKVKRDSDAAALTPSAPAMPCGDWFDKAVRK